MEKTDPPKIILVDCDVISHFITNNCLDDLPKILAPHRCTILDYVYYEATRQLLRKAFVDKLIKNEDFDYIPFPNSDLSIKEEFAKIKSYNYLIGDGERACMAVAKHNKKLHCKQ